MNCKGCIAYESYTRYNKINESHSRTIKCKECKYTAMGEKELENCPCKYCLLKCVCDALCEDFIKNTLTDMNSVKLHRGYSIRKNFGVNNFSIGDSKRG